MYKRALRSKIGLTDGSTRQYWGMCKSRAACQPRAISHTLWMVRPMRKPRDLDTELRALAERTQRLKTRKVAQLGELVIATGASELDLDVLAGALVTAVETKAPDAITAWRAKGQRFFRIKPARSAAPAPGGDTPPGGQGPGPGAAG
jgi:DNA-binding protein H-NS